MSAWPVAPDGRPLAQIRDGHPDFASVQWPRMPDGRWVPVGSDGRPAFPMPSPVPRRRWGRAEKAALLIVIGFVAVGVVVSAVSGHDTPSSSQYRCQAVPADLEASFRETMRNGYKLLPGLGAVRSPKPDDRGNALFYVAARVKSPTGRTSTAVWSKTTSLNVGDGLTIFANSVAFTSSTLGLDFLIGPSAPADAESAAEGCIP